MTFKTYFRSLDSDAREAYAARVPTSVAYIDIHLIPRRKIPRPATMRALAAASGGALSYGDIVDYFYSEPGDQVVDAGAHDQVGASGEAIPCSKLTS